MTKIKVLKRVVPVGTQDKLEYDERWDIYHGFTGIPHTLPFCTKWKLVLVNQTREEVTKYLQCWMLDSSEGAVVKTKN